MVSWAPDGLRPGEEAASGVWAAGEVWPVGLHGEPDGARAVDGGAGGHAA